MQKFRFHVLGLPHTKVTREFAPCAYTTKVRRFCEMMLSLGHEVYLYAAEGSDPSICTEFIPTISDAEQQEHFGAVNWRQDFFPIKWEADQPYWKSMNANAIVEIGKRLQPRDFLCITMGTSQEPVAKWFPTNLAVETGIGYVGVFSDFKVFESYAQMHQVYGQQKRITGGAYDAVIPNYYEVSEFPFQETPEDYFLYVGRTVHMKGIQIAVETCNRLGLKLIMAGQGVIAKGSGWLTYNDPGELRLEGTFDHVGVIDAKKRGELMSKAKAIFVPTQYIGPFEGVHVEAMLCGTPVLTSDWGVFNETVEDGVTGYRCRTLGEFMWAARNVHNLDRKLIRQKAIERFDMEIIKYRYQAYFQQLYDLWAAGGWYNEMYDPTDKRTHGHFK